jgi:hypothetical protein
MLVSCGSTSSGETEFRVSTSLHPMLTASPGVPTAGTLMEGPLARYAIPAEMLL